jgi:hypothetical protein
MARMNKPVLLLLCAALAACSAKQTSSQQAETKRALPSALRAALPSSPQPHGNVVSGTVAETMNSGGYTYLRLTTADGDKWAAVPETKIEKGSTANVSVQMVMENFDSKTLNRKFDRIIFGNIGQQQPAPMASAATVDSSIEKPSGGYAVAELFEKKAALKDKQVVVRGKVVKFLPEIMGMNWLHLRDGSGSAGTNDITVTTKEMAKVGDVITVTGTLHVDKDFGAGYSYPVIVESASLK